MQEPRLSRGPTSVQPPTDLERKILDLARRYVMGFPGTPENRGAPGHWYKLDAPPEPIRVDFLKLTGRSALLDEMTDQELQLHMGRADEGLIGITIWFRNADRYLAFLKRNGYENHLLPGLLPAVADRLRGRAGPRSRLRTREAGTVARVLAIHYLSRSGGGSRTLADAAELYRTTMERYAQENAIAGYPQPQGWEALPDGWRGERAKVLRELREDLGPL
jgi:hypothetical protein